MSMYLWRDREIEWWVRYAWTETGMWPDLDIMSHPVCRDTPQVGFRYRDKEVEVFSAECADHAFTEAVCFRTSRGDLRTRSPIFEIDSSSWDEKNSVAIMDEKAITMAWLDGFPQLLECPCCGRVCCHVTMHNPPGLMFDGYKDVEQPERCHHDSNACARAIRPARQCLQPI